VIRQVVFDDILELTNIDMRIIMDAKVFPKGVCGTISPYPTVVTVTTAHHNDIGMLWNWLKNN
jgi:hypothetical protein